MAFSAPPQHHSGVLPYVVRPERRYRETPIEPDLKCRIVYSRPTRSTRLLSQKERETQGKCPVQLLLFWSSTTTPAFVPPCLDSAGISQICGSAAKQPMARML